MTDELNSPSLSRIFPEADWGPCRVLGLSSLLSSAFEFLGALHAS